MRNNRNADETGHTGLRDSRPTIGLLAEIGRSPYHRALWKGFIDAAPELDVNLIWYLSDVLRASESGVRYDVLHDLISAERVDGLLVSGTLGNYVTPDEFKSFVDHYRPMPMVGITQVPGLPSVIVDNGKGMRDTVAHLIKVHGYRRIAFICGSENNEEAMVRYRAYADVLAEHGLPLNPDLVTPGSFVHETGIDAVRLLLDERKVKFEAIVAANDWMALGALKELEDRGIRVLSPGWVVGSSMPASSSSTSKASSSASSGSSLSSNCETSGRSKPVRPTSKSGSCTSSSSTSASVSSSQSP